MKKWIIYTVIVGSAAAIGVTGGVIGKRVLVPEELDYSNVDVSSMKMDCAEIVNKIDSYNGNQDKTKVFTTAEILNYSMEKYRRLENSHSFQFGLADTLVKQDIRACQIKNGDKYFEESVSQSSVVACANRMFQEGKDGKVKLCIAESKTVNIQGDQNVANYPEKNIEDLNGTDYIKQYGKTLDEMFIYLINEKTVLRSNVENKDNNYIITVSLDPEISTYFYKLQMKSISNLDALPAFESVSITYTLDSNLMLITQHVKESYTATLVAPAHVNGELITYFYPNQYLKIPELNEQVKYKRGN